MAPLDISRHAQGAGRRQRDDLTKVVPPRRRVRIDFRRTARSSISSLGNSDSIFEDSNHNDSSLKHNQIRAAQLASAIADRIKAFEDARPEKGIIGQFFDNALSRLEGKSTTSLDAEPTISTPSATPTAIATSTPTTDTALTTSTTSAVPSIPLPSPPPAITPPISTSIDIPSSISTSITTSTPGLPPSPSAVATNPTTSVLSVTPDAPTVITSAPSPTASIGVILPLIPSPLDGTSQSRNALIPNAVPTLMTSSSSTSIETTMAPSLVPQGTAIGSTATAQVNSGDTSQRSNDNTSPLSPTVAHVLIAAGAIGIFVIVVTSIYILTRMRYIGVLSKFRDHEIRRGDNGWFGWYKKKPSSTPDLPPDYPWLDVSGFPADQKPMAQRANSGTHLSPLVISKAVIPVTVTTPLLAESRTQYTFYEVPIGSVGPSGAARPMASRQATQSSKQDAYTLPSMNNINNTYTTDPGSLAQNVSTSFDPTNNQNRQSQLSSLSSGFGDGPIIIPGSPPKAQGASRSQENNRQTRGFSWVTSIFQAKHAGDRDTVYTTGSDESTTTTKRYRTVNSWVAQQTRHIERGQKADREIPNLPEIPLPIQSNVDTDEGSAGNMRSPQSQDAPNTKKNGRGSR